MGETTVAWRGWGDDIFREAADDDRLILLWLTVPWSGPCREMAAVFDDADVAGLVAGSLLPLRVDGDRMPHVQDRYHAGGWPTTAILTPGGEVLWSSTAVRAAELIRVIEGVLRAWQDDRDGLEAKIQQRRKALEAARSRRVMSGLVRREAADDVLTAAGQAFDPRNGGFGDSPKYPPYEVVELLLLHHERTHDAGARTMVEQTLDGILAGELWDDADGGFFRFAHAGDWTRPEPEKLLETNAGLLDAFAAAARALGRPDWRRASEAIVDWVEAELRLADGLYAGAIAAAGAADGTAYAAANAQWARALASAGARLDRPAWVQRAARTLDAVRDGFAAPDGLFLHARSADASPAVDGLLLDQVEILRATLAVARAAPDPQLVDAAAADAVRIQEAFWADDGGLYDFVADGERPGALRWRDRPFDLNALAARCYLDLAVITGRRSFRAVAERVLAVLSPLAGRYGLGAAAFASAAEEFFHAPVQVCVTGRGAAADALRAAANAAARADLRVWSLPDGGEFLGRPLGGDVAACVVRDHHVVAGLTDPDALRAAVEDA